MSYKQYRSLDLFLFGVILCIAELLTFKAGARWFSGQLYTLSAVPAIVGIVMIRWGWFSIVHALLGGFVYCLAANGTVGQFICYLTGNLFSLLAMIAVRKNGWEKVKDNVLLTVLYAILVSLLMQLGRAVTGLILGYELSSCIEFITTDTLSGFFAIIVMLIARKLDGIFENQKHYLIRINEEENADESKSI